MTNLGVSMADYQLDVNSQGGVFGESSAAELADLSKALEAGSITGRETDGLSTASGAPLKVESLEGTLKHLTYRESDIVLWRMINKAPAYNTVEEFNQLLSYGADRGGFQNEGELPQEEDSVYRRMAEHVKFLGVTKSVTHPMQLVRLQPGIGGIMQREIKNGTMWILRKVNRALAYANSAIVPQEFNGLYAQHQSAYSTLSAYQDSDVVVDLRGVRLTEEVIEQAAEAILENHGYADTLIAPPSVLSNFSKNFLSYKQIFPNTQQVTQGIMGQRVKAVQTQFGEIGVKYDKFLKSGVSKKQATAADSSKAPAAVTAGGTPVAVAADAASTKFGDGAGDYYYAVAAVNRYGESALTLLNAGGAQTVTATQSVDLSFTDGGGAYPATGYTIYRSVKDDASAIADVKFYPIFSISTAQRTAGYDGGSAGLVRDRNRFLPNTEQAFMLQNDTDVYEFKQLAPLMKMDLAVLAPATRFMILLYGTPQLYAPGKAVKFINIGTTAPS